MKAKMHHFIIWAGKKNKELLLQLLSFLFCWNTTSLFFVLFLVHTKTHPKTTLIFFAMLYIEGFRQVEIGHYVWACRKARWLLLAWFDCFGITKYITSSYNNHTPTFWWKVRKPNVWCAFHFFLNIQKYVCKNAGYTQSIDSHVYIVSWHLSNMQK